MRYVINTECLIAILLCQEDPLQMNEAVAVTNVRDYSSYKETYINGTLSYKLSQNIKFSIESPRNIVIFDELDKENIQNCYNDMSIINQIVKTGAVYKAIQYSSKANGTKNSPIFNTGFRRNNKPCIYHSLLQVILALYYEVDVNYFLQLPKMGIDNTMDNFNQMMKNNSLSVIYNRFIRMKSNYDLYNVIV